jgi:nucleoside-diphosphate-sugar epimerase
MKLGEAGSVMDKVVMIGVFDFVNFHVCKALLDKGIEVRGVQIETEDDSDILVEKRLEIGRNANLTEVSLGDISNDSNENETIVLSVYDLFMRYKEEYLLNEEMLLHLITKNQWEQIVILVPSQMLNEVIDSKAEVIIEDFLNRIKVQNEKVHLLYLPTLYGPWQPDTFLFQSTILSEMKRGKPFRGIREETGDALFVQDTAKLIVEIIENHEPGRYLLQSGKSNQWDKCAAFLRINEQESNRLLKIKEENLTNMIVTSTLPISVGMAKQIEHAHRIYSEE